MNSNRLILTIAMVIMTYIGQVLLGVTELKFTLEHLVGLWIIQFAAIYFWTKWDDL